MRIELLETVKHERDIYESGDVRTVPDGVGQYFCAQGWAKDVDGNVATGERDVNAARLAPVSALHVTGKGAE